jgi:hypothetical protein
LSIVVSAQLVLSNEISGPYSKNIHRQGRAYVGDTPQASAQAVEVKEWFSGRAQVLRRKQGAVDGSERLVSPKPKWSRVCTLTEPSGSYTIKAQMLQV